MNGRPDDVTGMEGQREPLFTTGDWVQDRNDRGFVGKVVREPTRTAGTFWYDIKTQTGRRSSRPESTLVEHTPDPDPEDLFVSSSFGDQKDLVRIVTYRKLSTPIHGTLYSLGGSKTEFHPHQYKPLIKFLDSHKHRLLLADEVGLGKTIEAGLILIEQRARDALDHVLVVCPASLTAKWKQEMWERFDEDFSILSTRDFTRLHERWITEGPPLGFRGIISLQSVRVQSNLERLEENPLGLDLVVFDEAHHLRNPETLSHKVGAALIPEAHAALLLTATPVQLGNHNLYHLLRLMEPGEFQSLEVFQERILANEPIVKAERLIRRGNPIDLDAVRSELDRALRIQPTYFSENPIFERVQSRIDEADQIDLEERVRLQDDLNNLNLLGSLICRSLRRDVFEDAPIRHAATYSAQLAPEERRFYDAVTDFVHAQFAGRGNIAYLVAVQAQRQVASCMPAARERFQSRAWTSFDDPELFDLQDELDLDVSGELESASIPERLIQAADELGDIDSKFEKLLDALHVLYEEEPDAKVLLFSYFKDTLRYLHKRLTGEGYSCELIHGEVPTSVTDPEHDERRKRMRRFQDPDSGVQLLLSSEVGSEGLDFQFCHVLINYDLPWNPMRVEQRIGRLDRIGQKSNRIVILNLSLEDTIEDRILQRLHLRIGIFKRSIGDLESILGDEIGKLTKDLLTQSLTAEEQQERIDQTATAIETRRREMERLEQEGPRFVERSFREALRQAMEGGDLLAPQDLRNFFEHFLAVSDPECQLRSVGGGAYELEPSFNLVHQVKNLPADPVRNRFYSRLQRPPVRMTFDSERAFHDDRLEYVGPHHPAMTLAVRYFAENPTTLFPAFSLTIEPLEAMDDGVYAFGLFERVERGRDERHFIEPLILDLEGMVPLSRDLSSRMLGAMLRESDTWEPPPAPAKVAKELMNRIRDEMVHRDAELEEERRERNENIISTQLASLKRTHEVRMEQHMDRLQTLKERGRGEGVIRMTEAQIRHEKERYRHQKEELERGREYSAAHELFACGLVAVGQPPTAWDE